MTGTFGNSFVVDGDDRKRSQSYRNEDGKQTRQEPEMDPTGPWVPMSQTPVETGMRVLNSARESK